MRKGNDFNELVNHLVYRKFASQKPKMYKALIDEGLKGNCKALELYFRLCGDLKHEPPKDGDTHIHSLTFVLPMPESVTASVQSARINHNSVENQDEVIDVALESSS